jgi:hypothetical protein
MNTLTPIRQHKKTANRRGSHRGAARPAGQAPAQRPGRRPSAQLISDGVVASYIHDISQRHSHRRAPSPLEASDKAGEPAATRELGSQASRSFLRDLLLALDEQR